MKEELREEFVSFRVSSNEYQKILEKAQLRGEGVNEWCRNLAMAASSKTLGMTANEQVIFEEVARIRFLFGNAITRLLQQRLTMEEWEKLRRSANSNGPKIVAEVLRQTHPEFHHSDPSGSYGAGETEPKQPSAGQIGAD